MSFTKPYKSSSRATIGGVVSAGWCFPRDSVRKSLKESYMYACMIRVCVYNMYIYIYIYICMYPERERQSDQDKETKRVETDLHNQ